MERLIYYPSFEVLDADWLKFALLYIDTLYPIIPMSGDVHLSERFRRTMGETDLVSPYRPEYDEGAKASLNALDIVQRMFSYPHLFAEAIGDTHFIDRWRNPLAQRYLLFREKYARDWEDFVKDARLARPAHEGIYVSKELGFIYMTILAQAIADKNGLSSITDHHEMDDFSIFTMKTSPASPESSAIARAVIRLCLPADIHRVSIHEVIKFRNRRNFRHLLHAYHTELHAWISSVEEGTAQGDFFSTRGSLMKDFSDEIASLTGGVIPATVGVWLLLHANSPDYGNLIEKLCSVGVLAVTSVISIRNAWQNTETRRFTRKYLADLSRIGADYGMPNL
jgi:hypothetical protein